MESGSKGQTVERNTLDPRQWSDRQVLDFLGTALRNVDLVGEVRLSEIRQGFEVVMGRAALSQQAKEEAEIPDFTPGNGNRARRRMKALSPDRWVPAPLGIDSEGGHCD